MWLFLLLSDQSYCLQAGLNYTEVPRVKDTESMHCITIENFSNVQDTILYYIKN